jgi:hypothetical protein
MKSNPSKSTSNKSTYKVEVNQNISPKMTKIIDTLNSYNYKLDGDEETLIEISKNEKYKMTTREDLERVLKLLHKYIKAKIRMCYNLNKIKIPVKNTNLHILTSQDFKQNNKLLLIIPDRGIDALGVFSNVGIIYESTRKGSMIDYIEAAKNSNYSFMTFNPNRKKLENTHMSDHYIVCEYIWREFISSQNNLNNVVIVAHRNSSLSLIKLMTIFKEDFKNKVKKIIFIDSSINNMHEILKSDMKLEYENKCTNYILSSVPMGTLMYSHSESMEGCENRSCGTTNPNLSHYYILPEIKKYLN